MKIKIIIFRFNVILVFIFIVNNIKYFNVSNNGKITLKLVFNE